MVANKAAIQREDVHFCVIRLLEEKPYATKRAVVEALGVSFGSINFCMKALVDNGHMKLADFKTLKNKLAHVYVLTPEGIAHRALLAAGFIQRKLTEFKAIRTELEELRGEFSEDTIIPVRE